MQYRCLLRWVVVILGSLRLAEYILVGVATLSCKGEQWQQLGPGHYWQPAGVEKACVDRRLEPVWDAFHVFWTRPVRSLLPLGLALDDLLTGAFPQLG